MTSRSSSRIHPMAWWFGAVIMLFVIWFGGWLAMSVWLDGKLASALERLRDRGIDVACAERTVTGFPFRVGVRCQQTGIDDSIHGFAAKAGRLQTAAQLYAPTEIVAELQSPFTFDFGTTSVDATWSNMRLYADATRGGFKTTSLTFENLDALSDFGSVKAKTGALHMRPVNLVEGAPQALEVAGKLNDSEIEIIGKTAPDPFAVTLQMTLTNGYDHFIVQRKTWQDWIRQHGAADLSVIRIEPESGGAFAMGGPVQLHDDGTVSGSLRIGLDDEEALARWVAGFAPELGAVVAGLSQGVAAMGEAATIGGRDMRAVEVLLDRNRVRVGIFEIGRLPPFRIE